MMFQKKNESFVNIAPKPVTPSRPVGRPPLRPALPPRPQPGQPRLPLSQVSNIINISVRLKMITSLVF